MIKIYSQYSYGGFRTFHIEGLESELLGRDSEVTLETTHDFPKAAHVFFQFGGSKLVYLRLNSGELALVVREIPSNDVDGAGRPLSCAVQFIGQEEDRQTLNNMALVIANDIATFGSFFADLFYVRQGLHIEGDKLRTYINKWQAKTVTIGNTHPALLSLGKKREGVFLFVPLSEKFGSDKDVTNRVCQELNLAKSGLKDVVIGMKDLMKIQKKVEILPQSDDLRTIDTETVETTIADTQADSPVETCAPVSADSSKKDTLIVNLEKELQTLKEREKQLEEKNQQQKSEHFKSLEALRNDMTQKNKEVETLKFQLGFYKIIAFGFAALSIVLAIALICTCFCTEEKKVIVENDKAQTEQVSNNNN